MIMVGFDGLSVTPEIRMMIEKYYVGNIILTRRNIQGMFCPGSASSGLGSVLTSCRWRSIGKPDARVAEYRTNSGVSEASHHWN